MRGATLQDELDDVRDAVSIHAPRAGRDELSREIVNAPGVFQSTRPVRGATLDQFVKRILVAVSIHAPRAGRDYLAADGPQAWKSFNPRAPCGARQVNASFATARAVFQSTRPVRGATMKLYLYGSFKAVSIHAPRAGRDTLASFKTA